MMMSAPPSMRACVDSEYASTSSSKDTLRKAGLFTSGEIEQVRFVGPNTPATKRGFSGVFAVHSSAIARANFAASRFNSALIDCMS